MSVNLKELEKILKGLGNRRRLAIVQFLKKNSGASVGDIAEAIKLSYKSTSHHLRIMTAAGILSRDQQSAEASYSLAASSDKVLHLVTGLL